MKWSRKLNGFKIKYQTKIIMEMQLLVELISKFTSKATSLAKADTNEKTF